MTDEHPTVPTGGYGLPINSPTTSPDPRSNEELAAVVRQCIVSPPNFYYNGDPNIALSELLRRAGE